MPVSKAEDEAFNEALQNIQRCSADNDPESTTHPPAAEDIAECLAQIWRKLGGRPAENFYAMRR